MMMPLPHLAAVVTALGAGTQKHCSSKKTWRSVPHTSGVGSLCLAVSQALCEAAHVTSHYPAAGCCCLRVKTPKWRVAQHYVNSSLWECSLAKFRSVMQDISDKRRYRTALPDTRPSAPRRQRRPFRHTSRSKKLQSRRGRLSFFTLPRHLTIKRDFHATCDARSGIPQVWRFSTTAELIQHVKPV